MNVKNILAPLGERITALTELVQGMKDNLEAQTELLQKIFHQLQKLNEKKTEGNTCVPKKST